MRSFHAPTQIGLTTGRKRAPRRFLCILLLAVLVLGGWLPAQAEVQPQAKAQLTILVLDMSGSMGTPGRDPEELRCSAARAYLDLARPTDSVGLIVFPSRQDQARAEVLLEPDVPIGQKQNPKQYVTCHADGYTPMADALQQAYAMLLRAGSGNGSVLLMSDGKPESPQSQGEDPAQEEAIRQMLPDFRAHGWRIDTIALADSSAANQPLLDFMQLLAGETGGKPYQAETALMLQPYFVEIMARRTGRALVPAVEPQSVDPGIPAQTFSFPVDHFARHFDLLVTRDAGVLVDLFRPGAQPGVDPAVSASDADVSLYSTEKHVVIYSIDSPATGQWQLRISGAPDLSAPAQVVADLLVDVRLQIKLVEPSRPLPIDQPFLLVTSVLDEQGRQILNEPVEVQATLADFRAYQATLYLNDGGAQGDERAGDGLYSSVVSLPPNSADGSYGVTIDVKIGSVQLPALRDQVITLRHLPQLQLLQGEVQVTRGAAAEIPLRLLLGNSPADAPNLLLSGFERVGGTLQPRELHRQGADITAVLPTHPDGQTYAAEVVLQMDGSYEDVTVTRRQSSFSCQVVYKPMLSFEPAVQAAPVYPTGWPITFTLGLLDAQGRPLPVAGPMEVLAGPQNGATAPCSPVHDDGKEGDKAAGDGLYAGVCPGAQEGGTFRLTARYSENSGLPVQVQSISLTVQDFPRVYLDPAHGGRQVQWGTLGRLYDYFPFQLLRKTALGGDGTSKGGASGQIRLSGAPYADWQKGTLTTTVEISSSAASTIHPNVKPESGGFIVSWIPPRPGTYRVRVEWSGDYAGRTGYSNVAETAATIEGVAATTGQWARAWAVTMGGGMLYLALLLLALLLLRARLAAPVHGYLRPTGAGTGLMLDGSDEFPRYSSELFIDLAARSARRSWWDRLLHPGRADASLWIDRAPPGVVCLRSRWTWFQGPPLAPPVSWERRVVGPWLAKQLWQGLWQRLLRPVLRVHLLRPGAVITIGHDRLTRPGQSCRLDTAALLQITYDGSPARAYTYSESAGAGSAQRGRELIPTPRETDSLPPMPK